MKRFACHRLYFFTGEVHDYSICEVDDKGSFLACYPFSEEPAGVVWLGGVCVLLPKEIEPRSGDSLYDLLGKSRRALPMKGNNQFFMWKACGLPVAGSIGEPVRNWLQVF